MVVQDVGLMSGFWLVTSGVLLVSYYIDQHPSAPNLWRSLFRWGKMRVGVVKGSPQFFEIPKRWYQHFYLFGILVNASIMVMTFRTLVWGHQWPEVFTWLLQRLQHPADYVELTDAVPVLLVLILQGLQLWRRCYETFCVNVFSPSATMTLLHYALGLVFYFCIGLCVLVGTRFTHLSFPDRVHTSDCVAYVLGVLIFTAASFLQHQSFRILAALRQDVKDKCQQSAYLLPQGGGFEAVSCPHFLAEMAVYLSFCVVFAFRHTVLNSLLVFVAVNQTLASLLTFHWYCNKFPGYAKDKYAVFPYIL